MALEVANPAVRTQQDALSQARSRVQEQRATLGDRHPEYASSLIQLALLLIMHDLPGEAEPLLREALDIRRATLGEGHPDYATCLSSIAGLHWARGDLDGAEPMLRHALEVRQQALGPAHPKTVVSRNSLDQLLQAKASRTEAPPAPDPAPAPAPAPAPIEPPPVAPEPPSAVLPPSPVEVPATKSAPAPAPRPAPAHREGPAEPDAQVLERLREEFARFGDQLTTTARGLLGRGVPPEPALLDELAAVRRHFLDLARSLASRAEKVELPGREPASLNELNAFLHDIERAEAEWVQLGTVRDHALGVLDRVLSLAHADQAEFPALASCHHQARELAQTLNSSRLPAAAESARPLTENEHPLSALLLLTSEDAGTSDESWAEAHEIVESHFGKALAVAAARGKLVPRETRPARPY